VNEDLPSRRCGTAGEDEEEDDDEEEKDRIGALG
jgi:hypothetical protein